MNRHVWGGGKTLSVCNGVDEGKFEPKIEDEKETSLLSQKCIHTYIPR